MLMAVGQGAGDHEALENLSSIYREGIGVSVDNHESLRWAAVADLMDDISSAEKVLQELGYPRGFTGVVRYSRNQTAARDSTKHIADALRVSLQRQPGFPASLFSCCFQSSVSVAM